MPYSEQELSQLVAETRRPYLTQTVTTTDGGNSLGYPTVVRMGRDVRWDDWRDVRHRRKNPWLPQQAALAFGSPLYYRDTRAGKAIDEITQRLGVNAVHFSVSVEGDAGAMATKKAETYEAWLRGVMHDADPLGVADHRVRQHQSADGKGWFELEMLQGYMPPPRQGMSDKDYDVAREKAARECALPFRLGAPDGRSLYTPAGQETPTLVIKVVNKPLIDVQNKWLAEGFQLGYVPGDVTGKGTIARNDYIMGGELPPMAVLDVGKYVRCVVVATGDMIYHLAYRDALFGPTGITGDDTQGSAPNLMLLASYRNPLGHPPFYGCSARTTTDMDPAYHDIPLAYELLELTPELNAVRSLRKIAAYREALKPVHAKPMIPQGTDPTDGPNKVTPPGDASALITPGVIEYDGQFMDIPTPSMEYLIKWDQDISAEMNRADSSIRAALKAGDMGKTTPAWAMQQFKEEENGFLSEALTSRANAYRDIANDITKLTKTRYGKDAPLFVTAPSANKKRPEAGSMDMKIGMKADDLPGEGYIVNVSIDALTQSQRAADTEYWRRLREEGTISQETYEDNVGIEDRLTESARKEREALKALVQPLKQNVTIELFKAQVRAIFGEVGEIVAGPANPASVPPGTPPPPQEQAPPEAPQPELPGEQPPVMPGQGMSLELPTPPSVSNPAIPVPAGAGA